MFEASGVSAVKRVPALRCFMFVTVNSFTPFHHHKDGNITRCLKLVGFLQSSECRLYALLALSPFPPSQDGNIIRCLKLVGFLQSSEFRLYAILFVTVNSFTPFHHYKAGNISRCLKLMGFLQSGECLLYATLSLLTLSPCPPSQGWEYYKMFEAGGVSAVKWVPALCYFMFVTVNYFTPFHHQKGWSITRCLKLWFLQSSKCLLCAALCLSLLTLSPHPTITRVGILQDFWSWWGS